MARKFPMNQEKDSNAAFFFLFLYTASTLIRPHEMFQASVNWMSCTLEITSYCFIDCLFSAG
jgi:hypothetical protein